MESTENLIGNILDILRFRIIKICSNKNKKNQIGNVFQEISSPFEGINTEPLLNAFLREKFIYVNYEVKLPGKTLTRKKIDQKLELCEVNEKFIYIAILDTELCEVNEKFIYIAILDSLQQLLFNDRISKMLFQTKKIHSGDVFYDIYDGSLNRNDSYFLGNNMH